ncbi:MAG: hypothetical protein IT247_06410 [Bacteroidia bacterium]|nr:hypothetical protein [Bacteroidia bacterium]
MNYTLIVNTINSILHKYELGIDIRTSDIIIDPENKIINWRIRDQFQEDKISTYLRDYEFQNNNQPETKTYFHYLPQKFLSKIINGNVRFYSLNKFLNQDAKEYKHFLEEHKIDLPKFNEQVDRVKDNVFIWCLSELGESPRHWLEFSTQKNTCPGACLELKLSILNNLDGIINFNKVIYRIDFLKEIQNQLFDNWGLKLDVNRSHFFAKNYKSEENFGWEKEFRLSIDLDLLKIKNLSDELLGNNSDKEIQKSLFIPKTDKRNGFKYLEFPLNNDFFRIEIINKTIR